MKFLRKFGHFPSIYWRCQSWGMATGWRPCPAACPHFASSGWRLAFGQSPARAVFCPISPAFGDFASFQKHWSTPRGRLAGGITATRCPCMPAWLRQKEHHICKQINTHNRFLRHECYPDAKSCHDAKQTRQGEGVSTPPEPGCTDCRSGRHRTRMRWLSSAGMQAWPLA